MLYTCIAATLTGAPAYGYINNSLAFMGSVGGVSLMATGLAQGKLDWKSVGMFTGGLAVVAAGLEVASNQESYLMPTVFLGSIILFLSLVVGQAPKFVDQASK